MAIAGAIEDNIVEATDIDNYAGGRTKSDGISLIQSIRRDSRDHPEFPTIGSHFSINSTLSGWKLGGQEKFSQTYS